MNVEHAQALVDNPRSVGLDQGILRALTFVRAFRSYARRLPWLSVNEKDCQLLASLQRPTTASARLSNACFWIRREVVSRSAANLPQLRLPARPGSAPDAGCEAPHHPGDTLAHLVSDLLGKRPINLSTQLAQRKHRRPKAQVNRLTDPSQDEVGRCRSLKDPRNHCRDLRNRKESVSRTGPDLIDHPWLRRYSDAEFKRRVSLEPNHILATQRSFNKSQQMIYKSDDIRVDRFVLTDAPTESAP